MKKTTKRPLTDEEIMAYDNVPIDVAARYIGWSSPTIYRALREERAPFGFAVCSGEAGTWTYNISPGLLVKYKRGDLPMGIASLVVIIAGAFTVVVMIVYYIQVMWSKISACAKNTMEYLQNKQDFEVYKADVLHWDMVKREKALRCRECAYRKKYMDEEAQP